MTQSSKFQLIFGTESEVQNKIAALPLGTRPILMSASGAGGSKVFVIVQHGGD